MCVSWNFVRRYFKKRTKSVQVVSEHFSKTLDGIFQKPGWTPNPWRDFPNAWVKFSTTLGGVICLPPVLPLPRDQARIGKLLDKTLGRIFWKWLLPFNSHFCNLAYKLALHAKAFNFLRIQSTFSQSKWKLV